MRRTLYIKTAALLLFLGLATACLGPDYTPEYFPLGDEDASASGTATPKEDDTKPTGSCTVQFTSSVCVSIKSKTMEVGTGDAEPLCTNLDPIPIEINAGTSAVIRGNTFPDIPFEGHGLPAPITINGKGSGDGIDNIGSGTYSADGSMTIEGFSLYIDAIGMVGEIPDLTFTTGATEALPDLPDIEGLSLDPTGAMTLVTGTVLGPLFPAADEHLLGASLQAIFEGTVSPNPAECSGTGTSEPTSTFVTKLVVDKEGRQTEALLPGATRMEVGSGTFISEKPSDVGPKFEALAKFKIINATSKPLQIDIPSRVGAFHIEAIQGGSLYQELPPSTPLTVRITFRPTRENTPETGEIMELLTIGPDIYYLIGDAVSASGKVSADVTDSAGAISIAQADTVSVGDIQLTTNPRREFFMCEKLTCNGVDKLTRCSPCVDVLTNVCQLLIVDKDGAPVDAVNDQCRLLNPTARDSLSINLLEEIEPVTRIIQIKNLGPREITINSITVQDPPNSKSRGQFKISIKEILPVSLPPYDLSKEFISVTIVYEPNDLIGFDGSEAFVGNPAKDKSVLFVTTDAGSKSVEITGTTGIKETPALQVFFKTSTGTKEQPDSSIFPFRGITTDTTDIAVPVFIKLSDSSTTTLRITRVDIGGGNFEWLDSTDKIESKPETVRCTIPILDSEGNMTGQITDLEPVSLAPNGFDLPPGTYSTDTMPLFGCVNFNKNGASTRKYESVLKIYAQEIGRDGQPVRNSDGSIKETSLKVNLLAVVNPRKGKMVFRITQTMAAVLHPQFPGISSVSSATEMDYNIADGIAEESDRYVSLGALVLDPFDEETIYDQDGYVVSTPNDGITAVYRRTDTHPTQDIFEDPLLADWTSLISDQIAPEGERGIFFDFPNIPEDFKWSGLRIYTTSLSYPGPLVPVEERPEEVSKCQQVNPCSEEGQKMHGTGQTDPTKKGVCAFFFTTASDWKNSSLREEAESGETVDLCKENVKQELGDLTGYYTLDGNINVPDVALRLWGPTFFHNPYGPMGSVPPLNVILNISFTTGVLSPETKTSPTGETYTLIPDKRVNFGKLEHKINLTDPNMELPPLCDNNTKNRLIHGELYSSWRYWEPFFSKDEEGTIPAGCPEPGLPYNGGSAFMHGRPLDQETGIISLAATAKFANDDNLTFAFKDVMFFIALSGWLCDPLGDEADFEGAQCFDRTFNDRDRVSTITIMK